jgi:hypothetical protein
VISSIVPLADDHACIKAGELLAFTENREAVLYFYQSLNEDNIIQIEKLPPLNNDSGNVLILYENSLIIDELTYRDDMHFGLLRDTEGVSLERVNPRVQTQDPGNWHSAAETVGFATPAYRNSQYIDGSNPSDDPVYIDPFVFSPDNDGFDDYTNIYYRFGEPGYLASVYVFDSRGRIVTQLANNTILSTQGRLVWDGLFGDGRKVPPGTYLVWFRINDLNGTVKSFKKAVVLAKKY